MTALPTRDRECLNLVCDGCGLQLRGISSTLRDWDVVWALISKHGWTGSPLAIGPHRCPECSGATGPEDPDPAETAASVLPSPWHASTRTVGDTAVVELHGDLDVLIADNLREVLTRACDEHRHVVVDLAQVRLIDSAALGVLVRGHQTIKAKGGQLCLAAPSRFIMAVLHTMRLQPVFPIFAGREQAMDWVAAGCP